MDYAKQYEEVTALLNHYSSKNHGIDLLEDGMYNYLLGKQSILREILQEQMTPRDFYELEFKR